MSGFLLPTIDTTESNVFAALRGLLQTIVPSTVEVIKAQDNRVPEPVGPDFIVMTPLLRTRLETNTDVYTWTGEVPNVEPNGIGTITMPTQMDIQLDIHGPGSAENAQIVEALWRDWYSTSYFDTSAYSIQALYSDNAKQIPFINAENQYENRWVLTLSMQVNPVVTVPQDFAAALSVTTVNVDVVYPID